MLMTGAGKSPGATAGCSQSAAFLARTAGLDATHTTAYQTLICNLVTQGVFAKLDGYYIFGTQTSTVALLNLVQNAFNLTANNAPVFTADQGYKGNGSNTFLDSGFIPGTSSGNFAQNSAHIGIWSRIAGTGANGDYSGMLAGDTTVTTDITNTFFSPTTVSGDVNSAFGSASLSAVGTGTGMAVANRSAAGAVQLYYQGASVNTNTTASVSLASAVSLTFLSRNFGGGTNQTSDEQIAAGVFGGSLTGVDQANLCHETGAFLFAVGAIGSNPC